MSERVGENTPNGQNGSQWDILTSYAQQAEQGESAESKKAQDLARRTRKLLACYDESVRDDEIVIKPLKFDDVEMGEKRRDEALRKVATGEVGTDKQKREILGCFIPPIIYPKDYTTALQKMSDEVGGRPLKILAAITKGDLNAQPDVDDLRRFLIKYSYPMEFEEDKKKLLDGIGTETGMGVESKRKTYENAMDAFSRAVYGKRQDYWEAMQAVDAEAKEKYGDLTPLARRTRKTMACYAESARTGKTELWPLETYDMPMDEEKHDEVLRAIASGEVGTLGQKREILKRALTGITAPEDYNTVLATMSGEAGGRALKILAFMTEKNLHARVDANNLHKFLMQFNSPMEFEEEKKQFLDEIEKQNGQAGAAKRKDYERAMSVFSHAIFGPRQDYWEAMQALDAEAQKKYGQAAERERGHEWLRGDVGYSQLSRDQVKAGLARRENLDKGMQPGDKCQDSMVIDPEQQIYAVLDGAGGMGDGQLASTTAARFLAKQISSLDVRSSFALADIMEKMNDEVLSTPGMNGSCTTASIARVVRNGEGENELLYASVGDSRIYVIDKDGKARLITHDEGFENQIWNAIGFPRRTSDMSGSPMSVCQQYGMVPLKEGDRVMICSDGITGDKGTDLMSNDEVGSLVHGATNATDAARRLITNARKRDDRSAIVFTAK